MSKEILILTMQSICTIQALQEKTGIQTFTFADLERKTPAQLTKIIGDLIPIYNRTIEERKANEQPTIK